MNVRENAKKLRGLMKISEAAEFCGVTAETMRNWDRSGRLVPERNPVTGYRYYRPEKLEAFLKQAVAERRSHS